MASCDYCSAFCALQVNLLLVALLSNFGSDSIPVQFETQEGQCHVHEGFHAIHAFHWKASAALHPHNKH